MIFGGGTGISCVLSGLKLFPVDVTAVITVSDHVAAINKYLGERKVDVVLANNGRVDPAVSDVYEAAESKLMTELDEDAVRALGAEVIADDVCVAADGRIRHDELKTAYLVFIVDTKVKR